MSRIPRFAIIPTNGRSCLADCLAAIRNQVDHVLVVWTDQKVGHHQAFPEWAQRPPDGVTIIYQFDALREVNISCWWNAGLRHVEQAASIHSDPRWSKWDVAILNDDAIVPEGWFDAASGTMRQMGVAAACSGGRGPMPVLHTQPGPVPLDTRLCGFAFMLAGEMGLRGNESLKWYFTDDWMDWESRKLGGMVMIPGFHVEHLYPNGQVTPEIQEQIAKDAQTFVDIYGMRPW